MAQAEVDAKYNQEWPWWPLLPLYPYGKKRTTFEELIPNLVWSFEQLQGTYYVAVPIRLHVLKVSEGLMLINPLPPTKQLLENLHALENKHGPVVSIVLPTASGLEHKIALPSLARAFPKATLWVAPGQWSYPIQLPLGWLGIPSNRTKILIKDGLPHENFCTWVSLGPIDIGLGNFQEISCYHEPSRSLIVTDALIGISSTPPKLFNQDPTPLLFHSRENGSQPLNDNIEARRIGWSRIVLFASFLKPEKLQIPKISLIFTNSFRKGMRNPRSHFGIYPFAWDKEWEDSVKLLIGKKEPLLQVPPVLEQLVFPRGQSMYLKWLKKLSKLRGIKCLMSSHFSPMVSFTPSKIQALINDLSNKKWGSGTDNYKFLKSLDNALLKAGVVPKEPLKSFKSQAHLD